MRAIRLTLAAAMASLALAAAPGCPGEPVKDEHRQLAVEARGPEEAFDALTQALLSRFENVDAEQTSREKGTVATEWRMQDEPERLVRRRAIGKVTGGGSEYFVEVAVERQISTRKTQYGQLDRQRPAWVGGEDLGDTTLEREILLAVKKRMRGEVDQ